MVELFLVMVPGIVFWYLIESDLLIEWIEKLNKEEVK